MHVRKQIRDYAHTALTGLTTTGSRVYPTRLHPFLTGESELPGIALYTFSEEVENGEGDDISHIQQRMCLLSVEGYAEAAANVEDTLDTIAAEVEAALYTNQYMGGIAHGIDLVATEVDINAEASKPVGVITMIFRVLYLTAEGSAETAL